MSTTVAPFPVRLAAFDRKDLPGDFNSKEIADFAISPDNRRIAVAFTGGGTDHMIEGWLSEWEIETKKLVAQVRLPNPISPGWSFIAIFHRTIQYTPDGTEIIVQAGRDLYAFYSDSLNLHHSASYADLAGGSASEKNDRRFAISSDGGTLAVLSGQSLYPQSFGVLHLYKISTGEELSHWQLPLQVTSISLSPSGDRVLVTAPGSPDATDILLLESLTGRVIKSFASGFRHQLGAGLNAQFVDTDHFVVTPGGLTDEKGNYLGNALRVFDWQTGTVTGDLTYHQFGPTGEMEISSDTRKLAMLNLWRSPLKRRFTESGGSAKAQLLFFQLGESTPYCVLGPLPEDKGTESNSGYLRFSPDLGLVGLFMNHAVSLYRVPECRPK